jgi:nitrilase
MPDPVSVAIIQSSPVFLDLEASVGKAITLTEEAARHGARLVTFGETWLPGYPAWLDYCSDVALWDHAPSKEVFARLRQNSVTVPGKETKRLAQLAGDHKLTLVIGVNERVETGPGNGTDCEKMTLDVSGHYSRPDIFNFQINKG